MKSCAYCGRANEDNAVSCTGCGTSEFRLCVSPDSAAPTNPPGVASVCEGCGATTDVAGAFVTHDTGWSRQTFCPLCWEKHRTSYLTVALLGYLAVGVVGLLMTTSQSFSPYGFLLINLFLFQFCLIWSIPLHEFAHAATAARLGWRVFAVYLGFGKPVLKGIFLGFKTQVSRIPMGGAVAVAPRELKHFRLKLFLLTIAGPAANVVLMLGFLLLIRTRAGGVSGLMSGADFIEMSFLGNAYVVAINLWPRHFQTTAGKIASDGLRLFRALTANRERMAEAHAHWFAGEGAVCHEGQRYEAARSWFERGLELYPENTELLVWRGLTLLVLKEFKPARDSFVAALPKVEKDPLPRALLLNNLAYTDVLLEQTDLLPEAERSSKEAFATLGWHPSIKGTRGTVLLQMGKTDEAIPLLREAMEKHKEARNKAENACWLAMAYAACRDPATARTWLEQARKLDASCFLLERAAKRCEEDSAPQMIRTHALNGSVRGLRPEF